MWNPLGAAVFAEADCSIGSSTALCLAAAACDRAGSLDSNSIIISPFKSSAFFRDYAQQWNLTSSMGGDSLGVCSLSLSYPSLSVFLSLSLSCFLSSLWSLRPPPLPLYTGFWPRAGHFTEADFPRLPKGYFTRIPIRSLPITNVPNHLQKNLFTLCGNGFIWHGLLWRISTFNIHSTPIETLPLFSIYFFYPLQAPIVPSMPSKCPRVMLSITVQYCTMQRCWSIVSVLQEKQVWCNRVVI